MQASEVAHAAALPTVSWPCGMPCCCPGLFSRHQWLCFTASKQALPNHLGTAPVPLERSHCFPLIAFAHWQSTTASTVLRHEAVSPCVWCSRQFNMHYNIQPKATPTATSTCGAANRYISSSRCTEQYLCSCKERSATPPVHSWLFLLGCRTYETCRQDTYTTPACVQWPQQIHLCLHNHAEPSQSFT